MALTKFLYDYNITKTMSICMFKYTSMRLYLLEAFFVVFPPFRLLLVAVFYRVVSYANELLHFLPAKYVLQPTYFSRLRVF